MTFLILAYLAGVFAIATPCILPILPFVLARVDGPFRRGGLPILLGLAVAFAATASLASLAGSWEVEANRYGRIVALALITPFGLTMLMPALAARMMAPIVSIGSRLSSWAVAKRATPASSALLGVATGLVWAPCTGAVLGLILIGAALRGPGAETSLLLLTYGLGAATSLATGMLFSGRLFAVLKRSARSRERFRRVLGATVVAATAAIWLGPDTGFLSRLSSASTNTLEQDLVATLRNEPMPGIGTAAHAAADPALSGPLSSLLTARQWLNTRPLRPADLQGKVILVNFWTYSCINCLRVLPHVEAWAEEYKDRGGVQTPEFAFEKDVDNVRKALVSLGVDYPVAINNDFRIWRAFDNEAWPAPHFTEADGRVRRHVFGEGSYNRSERLIRQLLSETNEVRVAGDIVGINAKGPDAAADEKGVQSPETYIGYANAVNFASRRGVEEDMPNLYRAVQPLMLNEWSLSDIWTIRGEFAALDDTSSSITYRFHARDLNLVLASSSQGHPIRFRVTIDGAPPGADHGFDVDPEGRGSVHEPRLYQLVRQTGPVADRTFKIEFFDAGVRAYAFTFG